MDRRNRPSTFQKDQSRRLTTGKWMAEDWKKHKGLSREFLRTPYGLEIKEESKMTEDTKKALEAIKPMAAVLGIDVMAHDNRLYCNDQKIGIACNSTWATCLEFIGYAFLTVFCKNRCIRVSKDIKEGIKRYWYQD